MNFLSCLWFALSVSYIFSLCQTIDEGVCESHRMCTHRHWLVENRFPHKLLISTSQLSFFFFLSCHEDMFLVTFRKRGKEKERGGGKEGEKERETKTKTETETSV